MKKRAYPFVGQPELVHAVVRTYFPSAKKVRNDYAIGSVAGERGESLKICCAGPKAGLWYDHAESMGGDPAKLVALNQGISIKAAGKILRKLAKSVPLSVLASQPSFAFDEKQAAKLATTWQAAYSLPPRGIPLNASELYMEKRGVFAGFQAALRDGAEFRNFYRDGFPVEGDFDVLLTKFILPDGHFGLYRIAITGEGLKAPIDTPKQFLQAPCPLKGGAIRLFKPTDKLGIAEGIETALAVHMLFGIPVWATCGAAFMASVEVPPNVKNISIFVDHDPTATGLKAGLTLRDRLIRKGHKVSVHDPGDYYPAVRNLPHGTDWLDILNTYQPHKPKE